MWKIIRRILAVVLIFASGVGGYYAAKVETEVKDILNERVVDYDTTLRNVDLSGINVVSDSKVVNVLIIGNDYRKEKGYYADGLTDTMIIGTIDKKNKTLKLTSLMRDMVVEVPGHGKKKLNAANSFGGIELLYKTIALNFNIELDGYVEVGFKAFSKIIDKVGGIEAELTESEVSYLNSTNYIRDKKSRNVKVGKQILNGAQALGYCRIRKSGTTINGLRDDYGRTWRQRTVISAIFDKIKKMPGKKWLDIAKSVMKYVKTDLSDDNIFKYMRDVISLGTLKVYQLQIPIEGYYRSDSSNEFKLGSSIVLISPGSSEWDTSYNAKALRQFIFKYDGKGEYAFDPSESDKTGSKENK